MTEKESAKFSKDYQKLIKYIFHNLRASSSKEEAQQEWDMLEAMTKYDFPEAKTMLGLAYLMEGKEWYNPKVALESMSAAAKEADELHPFCWYTLGSLYLNGKEGIEKDLIQAKYWIDKAASVGYRPAANIQELKWGDNPAGFLDWFEGKVEKEDQMKRKLRIYLPLVFLVIIIVLFFVMR